MYNEETSPTGLCAHSDIGGINQLDYFLLLLEFDFQQNQHLLTYWKG